MNDKIIKEIKKYWPVLLLVLLSFWALRPLFQFGFFTMHDDQQIARLYELADALRGGQFPVRWVSHLGFGFGYPLFIFYPPLVYYFGLIFYAMGASLIVSTKIVMGLGFVLSGLFMYLWVQKHFGKLAGLASAVFYIYAPYHIVDLYVRGAFSEFFSFVWIPACFWAIDNLFEKKNTVWIVLSAVFLSFVVLTHNLIALPFAPFFILYVFTYLLSDREKLMKNLKVLLITAILALGFSAFFWLPSLTEKKYTLVDAILTRELASYSLHFLYPDQLWQTPWGYGGSTQGYDDGMSLKVGKLHILVSLVACISAFIVFFLQKKRDSKIKKIFLISVLFALSLFMTQYYSKIIWDIIQPLSYLQFPWRFLIFASVFSSFLVGTFISLIEEKIQKAAVIIAGVIIVGAIYMMVPYIKPQEYLRFTDSSYIENQDIEWRVSLKSFEYMNKKTETTISPLNTTIINISKKEIPQSSFTNLSQTLRIQEVVNTSAYKKYAVEGAGRMLINSNYFPGWTVRIDGVQIPIKEYGKFAVMAVDVPANSKIVEAEFVNTPVRSIGNTITLLSIVSAVVILTRTIFKKSKKHEK